MNKLLCFVFVLIGNLGIAHAYTDGNYVCGIYTIKIRTVKVTSDISGPFLEVTNTNDGSIERGFASVEKTGPKESVCLGHFCMPVEFVNDVVTDSCKKTN